MPSTSPSSATDRNGRITDWNKGAERIFGWSAEEMRNEPVERFFTAEDRSDDRIGGAMRRALDEGCTRAERWHLNKDGSYFWVRDETAPLRDVNGTHLGFLKILRDRTQQKLFEVELQTRQAHLSAALAIARLGTFEWDIPTGTVRLDVAAGRSLTFDLIREGASRRSSIASIHVISSGSCRSTGIAASKITLGDRVSHQPP